VELLLKPRGAPDSIGYAGSGTCLDMARGLQAQGAGASRLQRSDSKPRSACDGAQSLRKECSSSGRADRLAARPRIVGGDFVADAEGCPTGRNALLR